MDRKEFERLADLIGQFIKAAPAFPGDLAIAEQIGRSLGKLEAQLELERQNEGRTDRTGQ